MWQRPEILQCLHFLLFIGVAPPGNSSAYSKAEGYRLFFDPLGLPRVICDTGTAIGFCKFSKAL
jgi:hypothetical protein